MTFQLCTLTPRNCQQVRFQLLSLASSLANHQWQEDWPPAVSFLWFFHLRFFSPKILFPQTACIYCVHTHTYMKWSWNVPRFGMSSRCNSDVFVKNPDASWCNFQKFMGQSWRLTIIETTSYNLVGFQTTRILALLESQMANDWCDQLIATSFIVCVNWVCDRSLTIQEASFAGLCKVCTKENETNQWTLLRLQTRKICWTPMKYSSVKNIKKEKTTHSLNISMSRILAQRTHCTTSSCYTSNNKHKKHAHEHVHCCWPESVDKRQTHPSRSRLGNT